MRNLFFFVLALALISPRAFAIKDVPAQLRLFGGIVTSDPKDINEELEGNTMKTFGNTPQAGIEATHALGPIEWGLRFSYRTGSQDEDPSIEATDYRVSFNQSTAALMLRVPVIKSAILRTDIFGGYGGSNTSITWKTATQDGTITKKASGDWFAQPWSLYGASVGVGYKKFYFVVEGGFENNKVKDMKRTGTVNTNVEVFDLSGSFFTVGIMFDGLAEKRK
jgi:hypothetical protein